MMSNTPLGNMLEPVEMLDHVIEHTWDAVCERFDINSPTPDWDTVFKNVELDDLENTANAILVNLLSEATNQVNRFSAWYTQPARSFGLVSIFCPKSKRYRWVLAPEAVTMWQPWLFDLCTAVKKNIGVIRASLLVGKWAESEDQEDPCISAVCQCSPPATITIKKSALSHHNIICKNCNKPFKVSGR